MRKWKPFLVSCVHILEPCTNFRGLKWGIDFWLRSEIGYTYGKSQFCSEIGYRFQGSGRTSPLRSLRNMHFPAIEATMR